MSRLWHSTWQAPDETSGRARSFVPDEVMIRNMQSPRIGEPSGFCDTCKQLVKLSLLKPNEQRWNTNQTATCSACAKYGDPHGRTPAGHEWKYTCVYCNKHDGNFYRAARNSTTISVYEKEYIMCARCAREWWYDECEYVGCSTQHESMICGDGWWVSVQLCTCSVCGTPDEVPADPTTIPMWMIRAGKAIVCRDCVEIAKEMYGEKAK